MTAVVGRVWSWVSPANLYRPWGSRAGSEKPSLPSEGQQKSRWGLGGLTSWVWGRKKNDQSDQITPAEEFWEAQETPETYRPLEIEDLSAAETEMVAPQSPPRWWSRMIPSAYFFWPRAAKADGLRKRRLAGFDEAPDKGFDTRDGELSDYGTPPPSPTPLSKQPSPFEVLARTWTGDILPEHYEICFNFLRHLFDLFVVGFLWTVSPPTKFVLDVLGVQGGLKLWLHGMAMFLVSSVGMAGLLWLVQEYLPQFALVYGIIQALVISVSLRQSVILGTEDEEVDGRDEDDEQEEEKDDEGDGTSRGTME